MRTRDFRRDAGAAESIIARWRRANRHRRQVPPSRPGDAPSFRPLRLFHPVKREVYSEFPRRSLPDSPVIQLPAHGLKPFAEYPIAAPVSNADLPPPSHKSESGSVSGSLRVLRRYEDKGGISSESAFRFICVFVALAQIAIWAAVFGTARGVVHDPDHRPIQGAEVVVKSSSSDYTRTLTTNTDGGFEATALPVGAYFITVRKDGFAPSVQEVVIA